MSTSTGRLRCVVLATVSVTATALRCSDERSVDLPGAAETAATQDVMEQGSADDRRAPDVPGGTAAGPAQLVPARPALAGLDDTALPAPDSGAAATDPEDPCVDLDEDGFVGGPGCALEDCDDTRPDVFPGALEVCDGIDTDCDGNLDNVAEAECSTDLAGPCAAGVLRCIDGASICDPSVRPVREVCEDFVDNDCDGDTDECVAPGPGSVRGRVGCWEYDLSVASSAMVLGRDPIIVGYSLTYLCPEALIASAMRAADLAPVAILQDGAVWTYVAACPGEGDPDERTFRQGNAWFRTIVWDVEAQRTALAVCADGFDATADFGLAGVFAGVAVNAGTVLAESESTPVIEVDVSWPDAGE